MTQTLLHIDTSARHHGSVSRDLSARIVDRLSPDHLIHRDLSQALPQITEAWVGATFTPDDVRTDAQRETLALSDRLVDELAAADTIVIGTPMYNFGIPASLKAWVDLIARVGRTFEYTETGPRGLLTGKRAIIAIATGGAEIGSDADFASGYLRFVLGFMGVTDVQIVAADRLNADQDAALDSAAAQITALAA
ncbi:FMN-dependent NADH-azoreductase [Sedimentitalea nanhaiensis]|uniref:FMN dependent NADH:quinone oxidoreductase n=1 Tax=Sedimentitalea nanhaiensis TaxID=999627 RepID=A0A1I6X4D9_9RHOB|nr:NAD(P)H-dependent oxidoreductase [Sedimentitalea nanhaiensis]SFT33090.1 FMN-dependent NADH-azoreductase [Sedimentitalea nanhaiensis]